MTNIEFAATRFPAEPPSFLNAPDPVTKAAVGMPTMISCRVFGAPEPKLTWTQNGTEIDNFRFDVLDNGTLYIKVLSSLGSEEGTRGAKLSLQIPALCVSSFFLMIIIFSSLDRAATVLLLYCSHHLVDRWFFKNLMFLASSLYSCRCCLPMLELCCTACCQTLLCCTTRKLFLLLASCFVRRDQTCLREGVAKTVRSVFASSMFSSVYKRTSCCCFFLATGSSVIQRQHKFQHIHAPSLNAFAATSYEEATDNVSACT